MSRATRAWLSAAVVYLLIGVVLGVAMGATQDFRLKSVHAHVNLLGWVTMALTGFIYRVLPDAAASTLAVWHFYSFQIALPVMLVGLATVVMGRPEFEPLLAIGSIGTLISVSLFAFVFFRAVASTRR